MTMISAQTATSRQSFTSILSSIGQGLARAMASYADQYALSRDITRLRRFPPYMLADIGLPGFEKMSGDAQEEFYARAVRNSRNII